VVSENRGLINVALTQSEIFLPMKVCSDGVSDNSGSTTCSPDQCVHDKFSFYIVLDIVFDNPGFDKHGSDLCALR
jgi:hypothetical protein